jgi:hypothetical protein
MIGRFNDHHFYSVIGPRRLAFVEMPDCRKPRMYVRRHSFRHLDTVMRVVAGARR